MRGRPAVWSGWIFSERCRIFPMLRNLWRKDACHVGTLLDIALSLEYRFHSMPKHCVLISGLPISYLESELFRIEDKKYNVESYYN